MNPIFPSILALFRHGGWELEVLQGQTIASATYRSGEDAWVFVAAVNEDLRVLTLFARAPEPCPAERIDEMLQFFNRANFPMTHGTWTLDHDDGEIRFRVGADLAGRDMAGDELAALTQDVYTVMRVCLPAVRSVIAGGDPVAAAASIAG